MFSLFSFLFLSSHFVIFFSHLHSPFSSFLYFLVINITLHTNATLSTYKIKQWTTQTTTYHEDNSLVNYNLATSFRAVGHDSVFILIRAVFIPQCQMEPVPEGEDKTSLSSPIAESYLTPQLINVILINASKTRIY